MISLFATISQQDFPFPASLAEKYRPTSIDDFAGLDKPKRILRKWIQAPSLRNWLFVGPSGTGKTSMGLAIAASLRAELHHIPSQDCNLETLQRVRKTCHYVPMAGKQLHLVLIDEADRMTDAAQVALLSELDGTDASPNTIWIFTCNAVERFEQRFLSRLIQVEFSSYGMSSDATELVARVWRQETGLDSGPNFQRIVKEANNNVREALMKLETEILAI
jgi:replication-associated recombination protein RarA